MSSGLKGIAMVRGETKPPTLRDIAKVCGVAVPTVSRALTQPDRHSPELTARIRAAAEQLGYDPSLHSDARRLSLRRYGRTPANHLVAFLLPQYFHHSPFFYDVFCGVMDLMAARGYGVLMIKGDRRVEFPACLRRGEVDGAITACNDTPVLRHLLKNQVLKTTVSALEPIPQMPRAIPDFRTGGRILAHWLRQRGYERIVYLQKTLRHVEHWGKYAWIYEGLRQGVQDCGVDPAQSIVQFAAPKSLWNLAHDIDRSRQEAMLEEVLRDSSAPLLDLLRQSSRRTALVAANDAMAAVLLLLLTRAGLRVPEEVGLCGFDDLNPLSGVIGARQLSTIQIPLQQCGEEAARLLLDLLNAPAEPAPAAKEDELPTVLVPVTLVEGTTA